MFTNIEGWEYEFEELPYWEENRKTPYVQDILYENTVLDMAILHYSIIESRMCFYEGFIAIFKNKKKPELMLKIKNGTFTNMRILISSNGKFAFAQSFILNKNCYYIFVFDLINLNFSCFEINTDNNSFWVEEIRENEFVVVADELQLRYSNLLENLNGMKIMTDKLNWIPFGEINSFFMIKD